MPKRDLDRMRQLLLWVEACGHSHWDERLPGLVDVSYLAQENGDSLDVSDKYQIWLMVQCGWLDAPQDEYEYCRLTSEGHDYLDCVRDNGVWEKTKATVAEAGGSVTLEIIQSLAIGFLKKKIKDQTGVDI